MQFVAWDIETCPFPVDSFSEAQRSRFEERLTKRRSKRPDEDEDDAARLVRSLHPLLGWVCCISAVRGSVGELLKRSNNFATSSPEEGSELL